MARRFRRLRRAAHQVIEVTRRFWRFCYCCGTVRTETSREVIPVAVVLSCTNLPRARTSLFSWHCCTGQYTRKGDVVSQTSRPSFIGPQNWIRPTDSGAQSVQGTPSSSTSRQHVPSTYMPGSFSREFPSTSSSRGVHQPEEDSLDYQDLRATRSRLNHFPPGCPTPVPIYTVSGRSQTDDHVPLRFLYEPQNSQSTVYSEESIPRNWGSSNPVDAFRSPSGRLSIDTVGRDYQMNPSQATGSLSPGASNIFTGHASINNINPSVASVEMPMEMSSPRRTRFQRFDENDKYLGYLPSPSGTSLVVAPSPSSRSSRALPKPVPKVKLVPSIPSRNPIDALRSPSGKLCIDRIGSHSRCCHPTDPSQSQTLVVSPKSSNTIGLHGLVDSSLSSVTSQRGNSPIPISSGTHSRVCVTIGNTRNLRALSGSQSSITEYRNSCSYIALPGCSKADPQLKLNLDLLGKSSTGLVISPDLRVEFAFTSEWNELDPGNWGQRYTIARTRCGTVDVAYCDKFRQKFALKTLSTNFGNTEVDILTKCQGPFVAEMHAVLSQGEEKLLCTSFYERLDLAHWLRKDESRTYFGEREAALISSYVLTGLEFIHNKGVLHLDIKPANILLCTKGYPVIGDFGSARNINKDSGQLRHFTPAYSSPEVLAGECPTTQADLWSTACVFYEIVSGRSPYEAKHGVETELRIIVGSTPDVSMMSIDAQHFICAQFKLDKTNRLGFSFGAREVMKHRVFHKIHWDDVKYGHRHFNCPLVEVLRAVEKAYEEPSQNSSSSVCNINNSSRWELWSSSSSGEDSDEEFGYSSRALYTVEEEIEEYGGPEAPKGMDHSRALYTVDEESEEYGGPEAPKGMDHSRALYTVDEESEEYGGPEAPKGMDHSRALYTVDEESEEYGGPEAPKGMDNSRALYTVDEETKEYGGPEAPTGMDHSRDLWTVLEEDEECGDTEGPNELELESDVRDEGVVYDELFVDTGGG